MKTVNNLFYLSYFLDISRIRGWVGFLILHSFVAESNKIVKVHSPRIVSLKCKVSVLTLNLKNMVVNKATKIWHPLAKNTLERVRAGSRLDRTSRYHLFELFVYFIVGLL